MRLALFAALLATTVPLAATHAAPTSVIASEAQTYNFTVGALKLTALNDGQATRPNDGKTLSPVDGATAVLASAGLPTSEFKLSFGGLLVRDGNRIVLIDTGVGAAGAAMGGGKLAAALASTGITPARSPISSSATRTAITSAGWSLPTAAPRSRPRVCGLSPPHGRR